MNMPNWEGLSDKIKRLFKNRCFYVTILLVVVMSVMIGRLYQLQIIDGAMYRNKAFTTIDSTTKIPIDAPRGNIYDRNGILLATTRKSYKVQMVNIDNPQEERNAMYLELINLFMENGDTYTNTFAKYLSYPIDWGTSLKGETAGADRKSWINTIAMKKSDRDRLNTPQEVFNYLRNERFQIDAKYSEEEAYKIMIIRYETFAFGLSYITPSVIAEDCCDETVEIIEARYLDFPGVTTEETYFREYVNAKEASHLLGYVRAISEEEYAIMKDQGYSNNDIIGKIGIEQVAEGYLRGVDGIREVYIDKDGVVREYSYTDPNPGNDVYLTIDYTFQQKCVEILKEEIENIKAAKDDIKNFGDAEAGSVVVLNAKTGETLAMANYPNYDNSIFLEPSSNKTAQQAIVDLFNDPTSPSLNRATQGLYPVGSTFKPITALAALADNVTNDSREIKCNGFLVINNHTHSCMGYHGNISLKSAIAKSCNVYFQQIGVETGVNDIDTWAKKFGLGEKTGIEINEYAGYRSNPDTMKIKEADIYHKWTDSDTAQTAIGQLYTLFTPIQLARYAAALGNNGVLNVPYLIGSVKTADGTSVIDNSYKNANAEKIDVSSSSLESVKSGMIQMVLDSAGAAEAFAAFPKGFVAAKTGTPETGMEAFGQSSHSVLICYAPANDPEIAVAIVIEHGARGSNALPIAGKIFETYFYGQTLDEDSLPRNKGFYWENLVFHNTAPMQ